MTETVAEQIARLEREVFLLEMKDRWNSDDYLENNRMQDDLRRLYVERSTI